MAYRVEMTRAADRALRKLPEEVQVRLVRRMGDLGKDPRPPGVKRLQGPGRLYRVREGDYRIVYTVQDPRLLVLVVAVGHRRDAYRGRQERLPSDGARQGTGGPRGPRLPVRGRTAPPASSPHGVRDPSR